MEVLIKKGNKKISSKSKIKKINAIKKKCKEILGRNSGVVKNPHSKGLSLSYLNLILIERVKAKILKRILSLILKITKYKKAINDLTQVLFKN